MSGTIVDRDGFEIVVRDSSADHLALGQHEHGFFDDLLTGGDTFIDVGAHTGLYTLRMSRLFEHVIAYEPDPSALRALRANLALNAIENVMVRPVAAWSHRDTLRLDTGSLLASGQSKIAEVGVTVEAEALDELYLSGKPDVIKIDTEGSEPEVLLGAVNLLRMWKPLLIVEMHDRFYNRPELVPAVEGVLNKTGYSVVEDRPAPGVPISYWICR